MSLLRPPSHSALTAPQNSTMAYFLNSYSATKKRTIFLSVLTMRVWLVAKIPSRLSLTSYFFALTYSDGKRSPRITPLRREDDEDEEDGRGCGKKSGEARHVCSRVGHFSRRRSLHLLFSSWFSSHNFSLIRPPWSSLRPREIESKAQNRFTPPKRTDGRANGHSLARSPARHHTCSFEPPIWAGCVPAPGTAHALASELPYIHATREYERGEEAALLFDRL